MVSFMHYDLGFFDKETRRVEGAENPFGAKVLPSCPEWTIQKWRGRRDSNPRPSGSKPDALSN